jgi:hypothetical protein
VAIRALIYGCVHPTRLPSLQTSQIGRYVGGFLFGQSRGRHCITWNDILRVQQPENHVVGCVGQHTGDEGALSHAGKRRADATTCANNSRDFMARAARMLLNQAPARFDVAPRVSLLLHGKGESRACAGEKDKRKECGT